MNYQIFKQIGGRKTYWTVENDGYATIDEAIAGADKYFKAGRNNLDWELGRVIGDDLYLDSTRGDYPYEMGVLNYRVIVVYRKRG